MADKTRLQKFWASQISSAKTRESTWRKEGDTIVNIYRKGSKKDKFNILWSNTEILKAATLSRIAPPNISRRYKDGATAQAKTALIEAQQSQDQNALQIAQVQLQKVERDAKIAKDTSEILERVLEFQSDENIFTQNMRKCRDDMLLPGRGVMWYEYDDKREMIEMTRVDLIPQADELGNLIEQEPVFTLNGVPQEPTEIDEEGRAFVEELVEQSIVPKYVYWKDYLHSDSRSEEDVWWKARRHGLTKDELMDFLQTDDLPTKFEPVSSNDEGTDVLEVWEIWSKPTGKRIWFTETALDTLQIEDVPLKLKDFFPAPKPLFAFSTTNTMVPMAEYSVYEAQAIELNAIIRRLSKLTKMMKVAGVYNGSREDVIQDLSTLGDGQYKAIKDAASFSQSGGFAGAIFELPLAAIAAVIDRLENRKIVLKGEIFELIGISDIIRGDTNANETATAQRLKGSFGSLRLRPRREPMEEFIRDGYRIMAEIIADKFEPEAIQAMTGLPVSQEIMKLLRSDEMRNFRIDVETDSTVQPNEVIDQQKAVEFATAMGGFFQQAIPVVQTVPQMAPLVFETIKFVARQFKAGRGLEDEINRLSDQLEQQAAQPQQPQEDPGAQAEQMKGQIEQAKLQLEQQKLALEAQKIQIETQTTLQIAQTNAQIKQAELAQKSRIEDQRNETTIIKNVLDVEASNRGPAN